MARATGPDRQPGTQAVDRTAELVRLVVQAEDPVTYTELVAATGLPRSTVSRLLGALERGGLLERDESGGFRGGPLFTEYASRFDRVETLVSLARPHLEDIADATGETANLAVARGAQIRNVDQVDARFVVGTVNWLTVDVPGHCSALGKVLYAWGVARLPSGRLETRTPASLATHAALHAELDLTRERGYALTRGELEDGLDGIAVPVRAPDGSVTAALGISGPTFRIGDRRPDMARLLSERSAAIPTLLGRRQPRA